MNEKLNELYKEREQQEDWLMSLPVTSGFYVERFEDNAHWRELNDQIDAICNPQNQYELAALEQGCTCSDTFVAEGRGSACAYCLTTDSKIPF